MAAATNHEPSLAESLADLRRTIGMLTDRVAALESKLASPTVDSPRNGVSVAVDTSRRNEEVTPEIIAVITAALAAHLGIRLHIRQIRLAGNEAWAQQGRATIQASHALTITRD